MCLGIIVGGAAIWYYRDTHEKPALQRAGEQIESAAKNARDSISEKLKEWNLSTTNIKEELARTGKVIREKAEKAGHAISDATADARITAAIKGKLVTNKELSALSISVNTTDGIVTLSGTVSSADDIGKAVALAMDTDGVHKVISTLQVKKQG